MKTMTMKTAVKKAREGYFEFIQDAQFGVNTIMQKVNGAWKEKTLFIKEVVKVEKTYHVDINEGKEIIAKESSPIDFYGSDFSTAETAIDFVRL